MIIDFWENNEGESPVLNFIGQQAPKVQAKIWKIIKFLEEEGLKLMGSPYLDLLHGFPIYEIRTQFQSIQYRVFFPSEEAEKEGVAYLLHGFIKNTSYTPNQEIIITLERIEVLRNKSKKINKL